MPRLAILGLAAFASAAPAEADSSEFAWLAPSSCPSAAEVRAKVEKRLGASLDGAIHGIEIAITREAGGFVARIDARAITVANDVRTLRSARCDSLADGVAVIVARLASEARTSRPATRPVRPAPARTAALGDERVTSRVDVAPLLVTKASSPRWGGGIQLLGLSGIGALPQLNLGGEVSGYVRRNTTYLGLGFAHWQPQTAYLVAGAPPRVDVALDVLALRAGWGPRHLPLRAWLLGEIGRIQGTGVALDDSRTAGARWTAVGAGFGVAWPMADHARLIGTIELAVPLERTRFALESGQDFYQPAPAAARCAFGVEVGWR